MEKVKIDLTSIIVERKYDEFRQAVANASAGTVFVLEKGEYDIDMGFTQPAFYYVSNNDGSVKNVFFLLRNKEDIEIDLNGSTLVFHGEIFPFIVDQSKNVVIQNFSVKYSDAFYLQGRILEKSGDSVTIECSNRARYRFEGSDLILYGEGWTQNFSATTGIVQEFDGVLNRVAYHAPVLICKFTENDAVRTDIPLELNTFIMQPAGEGKIRFTGNKHDYFTVGNQLVMSVTDRKTDIILINDSKNITVQR